MEILHIDIRRKGLSYSAKQDRRSRKHEGGRRVMKDWIQAEQDSHSVAAEGGGGGKIPATVGEVL